MFYIYVRILCIHVQTSHIGTYKDKIFLGFVIVWLVEYAGL